jgi:hypothetical protein
VTSFVNGSRELIRDEERVTEAAVLAASPQYTSAIVTLRNETGASAV